MSRSGMAGRGVRTVVTVVAAAALALVASGCAVFGGTTFSVVLGQSSASPVICGSGAMFCTFDKGNSDLNANTGTYQVLFAAQVPPAVVPAETLTSDLGLPFESSPGYAAELQRLEPAAAGTRWVGWISAPFGYSTDPAAPHSVAPKLTLTFPPGPDGSPTAASLKVGTVVGFRNVTSRGPASRPVSCGNSLTAFNADVPDNGDGTGPAGHYCKDDSSTIQLLAKDVGVVTSAAKASGPAGIVASLPFVIRNSNVPPADVTIKAATTLPGATAVPLSPSLTSPINGDVTALVAVGVPAGTAPGVYDVTLTATLTDGTVRTGVGRITVTGSATGGGGGGAGGGGAGAVAGGKARLTTILAKGLTVGAARSGGIPVLIGSSVAGPAVVTLQQGPRRRPALTLTKRVRLKSPGPVKVIFKNRRLAKGAYRITISRSGTVVKTAVGTLRAPKPARRAAEG